MTIRILHLEDDHLDSELVEATLAADGLDVNSRVVATRDEYTTALRQPDFDLILADFSLPAFDGLAALALAQAARPDLPFIFVTGVMGEEQAIETLKRGAVDYVYKNRLSRLAPAVRRALREANERRERLQAQAAAQAEREWLRVTLGSIGDAVIAADTAGRVTFLNAVAERLTGWSQAEAAGRPVESVFCLVDEATRRPIEGPVERVLREGTIVQLANHTLLLARDGHTCPIDDSGAPIRDEHGTLLGVVVVFRDVTQRRQAEAARNEAEARFRILANTAPVMVWMAGPDGRSDFFNNAWLAFTGHSFEQEAGEGWWDGVHPDDYARCLDTYRTAYAERRPFEMELRLRRTDGEFRWIVDMGVPRFAADGSFAGYVGSCIDIHERKAAASALAARAQQQAAVAELGQRALAGLSLPELMQAVADKVAGTLDVEYTKILQLLPDGSALRLVAGHGWREGLVGAAGEDSESPAGYSLHSGLPVIVHDLRTETRFNAPPMLSEHGVVSGLSTVIRGQPQPYGVLGAYTRQRRDFTPDDASFLQSMANVLADAIARHAAEQALRQLTVQLDRALAEAELLNTLAGDTSGEADLGRILAIALDHLRRVMAFTGGSIALVEGDALIIRAAAGPFAEQALGQRLPRGKGPSWHVVETGRQFVSNNLEESQYAPTTPIRSFLAVPLIWRGQTFGLLEVDSTQAGAFSPGDEYLLQRAATVLSGSIQLAQLHTDLERRVLARTAELQAANQQLQQSQRLLSQAQQMAHLGSWHWDIAGNTVAWSDELYHMYGLDRESFPATYEGFLERVHPDDRPLVSATIRRAIEDHQPFTFDHRIVRPDGSVRTVHARGEVNVDALGASRSMFGVSLDITERKHIEDELLRSREALRRLSVHLQEAREEERRRIAREVHDELGGAMTSLKLDVGRLIRLADSLTPEQLREEAGAMAQQIDATIKTVRRIATDLRPGILDDLGLLAAIEWQLQDFQARSGIHCRLRSALQDIDLDADRSTAIFRVFQETLTNIARHAQATRVEVKLAHQANNLVLRVHDNGRGISEHELSGSESLGLLGMRERVRLLAGDIDIKGSPGRGTLVQVRVPLNSNGASQPAADAQPAGRPAAG